MISSAALAGLAAVAWTWLCPVCFSATEANRDAFLGTTVLLSLLPLAFIAGVLWFLRQRFRESSHGDPNGDV